MGRMIGESLPGRPVKERFGLAAILGLLSIFGGSIAVGMLGAITSNWKVEPWMDFPAWAIAFVLASQFGVWRGWREAKRNPN